ncbi:MAG: hypothetical protein PXX77_11270 [Gallionella sp.]|nr:hypothetical protein [Gallionella sp.]
MSTKLTTLLHKREQIEQQILQAKQLEKRKARAQQIVIAALEKHQRLVAADEQLLRERVESAFSEIAQYLPAA